jgi:2-haloacid dehalogenase
MPRFGLRAVSDDVLHGLTMAWHRLDAWPDVPAALKRLRNHGNCEKALFT